MMRKIGSDRFELMEAFPEDVRQAISSLPDDATEAEILQAFEQSCSLLEARDYENLMSTASAKVDEDRQLREGFEWRHWHRWEKGFDLFDLMCIFARELGEDFNRQHRPDAAKNQDHVFEALTRIHARACHIALEVRALMVSGHASGALARWRSIHELSVIAYFLKEHGDGTAEQYMLHEHVRTAKEAATYEKFYERLNAEPPDIESQTRLAGAKAELVRRFGPNFTEEYGWASSSLKKTKPNFAQIEESVGMSHWRPYFGMASHSVHAGYKGMTFDIGMLDQKKHSEIMLVGPTNTGLTDPAHCTAISLLNCTIALLNLHSSAQTVVGTKILQRLSDDVGQEFLRIQEQQMREEEEISAETANLRLQRDPE